MVIMFFGETTNFHGLCKMVPLFLSFFKKWVVPEKIHTLPTDGILEILAGGEGGSKTLEIQAGGG